MLNSKTVKAERGERVQKELLITRYDPSRAAKGDMLSIEDILEILSIPLIGIIPESEQVLRASKSWYTGNIVCSGERPRPCVLGRRAPAQRRRCRNDRSE